MSHSDNSIITAVSIEICIHDEAEFRAAARKRACKDRLPPEEADRYLNAEETTLGECAVMILDPGVSPDGCDIIGSYAD
jgi:hypothetical protein